MDPTALRKSLLFLSSMAIRVSLHFVGIVLAHQANARQGNASTKTRAEVAGSGKKLFRQKGSGTARQGSRRVPHQRHGGVAHGPKPRDFSQKINRKMKTLAFQRALYERANEGGLSKLNHSKLRKPRPSCLISVKYSSSHAR